MIMNCVCGCHTDKEIVGHSSLCCEFPNGKKKNNPYKKLKSVEYYRKILEELSNQWEEMI